MNKSEVPFSLIHSDVWGPSPVSTASGHRWFVIFVDDCTRMTWLYLLKHKDEVLRVFKLFHVMVQTQFSAKIQIFRSDNGGEYVNRGSMIISNPMEYFMKPPTSKLLNKMVLLNEKTDIYLRLLVLFYLELMYPTNIGVMLLLQLCTSSTVCLPKTWILKHSYRPFQLMC